MELKVGDDVTIHELKVDNRYTRSYGLKRVPVGKGHIMSLPTKRTFPRYGVWDSRHAMTCYYAPELLTKEG